MENKTESVKRKEQRKWLSTNTRVTLCRRRYVFNAYHTSVTTAVITQYNVNLKDSNYMTYTQSSINRSMHSYGHGKKLGDVCFKSLFSSRRPHNIPP